MRPDYPAAHSMDTLWFAVDREGHVAAFSSGEAGAVPVDGYLGEEWGETLEAIKQLPRLPGSPEDRDEDSDEAVLDHGVFYYDHEKTENILAGPYTQVKPVQPIKIDQLPYTVREVVERVKFADLSFGATKELQPIDHTPCEAWGAAYLADKAGTVKPIPGKETEYKEEYKQFAADIPEYKWEAPAPGIPASKQAPPDVRITLRGRMESGDAGDFRGKFIKALIILAVIAVYILVKYLLLKD